MRIEPGSRCGYHVTRYILKVSVSVLIAPHVKESRLNIRSLFHRLDDRLGFTVGTCLRNARGKLSRIVFGKVLEENDRQIRSFWLWCPWVVFDPLRHDGGMRLGPGIDVGTVAGISIHPSLRRAIMGIRPLGYDVRVATVFVLLEPAFDIGRHELSCFGAAFILHNWAERAGNPIA